MEMEGQRIDIYVAGEYGLTRSAAQKIIENGGLRVNGAVKREKNYKIRRGDIIDFEVGAPREIDMAGQDLGLDVLYEDGDVIVVNKRQGMMVHPAQDNYEGTLANALLWHCKGSLSGINGEIRPGIVHRLDRDTSGVIIAAKNDRAHLSLAGQLKSRELTRVYSAVIYGNMREGEGVIRLPLGRSKKDFRKVAVYKAADPDNRVREAVTHYKVLERFEHKGKGYELLELRLETGRTHQIRVHLAHLGRPVVGDVVYGLAGVNKDFGFLSGQCLHSRLVEFAHPVSGERIRVESELPEHFKRVLEILGDKYGV